MSALGPVHAELVGAVLADLARVADLLRGVLPNALVEAIDWSTLTRESSEYPRPACRRRARGTAWMLACASMTSRCEASGRGARRPASAHTRGKRLHVTPGEDPGSRLHAGRAEERARAVLGILGKRGIAVSEAARKQVEACTDLAELERLFDRAFEVTRAEELFTN